MDKRTDKDRIDLFVKEALNLQSQPFVSKTKGSIKISQKFDPETGQYNETFEKFEYNDFVALLLSFRKFISNDEPIFINSIFNKLEILVTDEEMKDFARKAREKINEFKEQKTGLQIGDKEFTYDEVKNIFINGFYFHLDKRFTDFLDQLPKDKFARFRWFFFDYVSEYTGLVL